MPTSRPIYLDHAATTPVSQEVLTAMRPFYDDLFYNASALYRPARQVKRELNNARHQVAQALGAKPGEIIFTAGATESINLAILGTGRQFPDSRIIVTAIEHEAVIGSASAAADTPEGVITLPVGSDGVVDVATLQDHIDDATVLVSVQYANNEIGTIQPIRDISRCLRAVREDRAKRGIDLPLLLHTDSSQAANYLDLNVRRLGVDLMTINSSKVYGPKQTGCLFARAGVQLEPLVYGSGQERALRSGTENVGGYVGFATALSRAAADRKEESARLETLRDRLITELEQSIDGLYINGDRQQRLPNNVNLTAPGASGETLVHHLDQAGILVATGAACTANKHEPSHVLKAIGLSDEDANSSLRLTMGRSTTGQDIDYVAETIPRVVRRVREVSGA